MGNLKFLFAIKIAKIELICKIIEIDEQNIIYEKWIKLFQKKIEKNKQKLSITWVLN